ncbi:helix-turn-helix domain-containing protein [uncultured Trichococcus sp.]|uniref:helix-turn-helix domain-containing protein n=1 Tax=uncultured Trichococcus sp. TaxID=189665 RepID=UPI002A18844E|nr:helix-turn-helix domain-containing protein [uncultured Trichococcus sp.]
MTIDKNSEFEKMLVDSNLKLKGIAEGLDITPSTLWLLRKDPKKMTVDQVEKLAKTLGKDPIHIMKVIAGGKLK